MMRGIAHTCFITDREWMLALQGLGAGTISYRHSKLILQQSRGRYTVVLKTYKMKFCFLNVLYVSFVLVFTFHSQKDSKINAQENVIYKLPFEKISPSQNGGEYICPSPCMLA